MTVSSYVITALVATTVHVDLDTYKLRVKTAKISMSVLLTTAGANLSAQTMKVVSSVHVLLGSS